MLFNIIRHCVIGRNIFTIPYIVSFVRNNRWTAILIMNQMWQRRLSPMWLDQKEIQRKRVFNIYLSSSYLIFSSQDPSKGNQFFPIPIHWSRKRDNSDASIILGKNPRLKWNNLDPPRIDASISQPFVVEFLRATKVTIIPTLRVSFSKGRKEKESKK